MGRLVLDPVTVGVDVGQRRDPTAIVVCEANDTPPEEAYTAHLVERLPLGTRYPQVAARIGQLIANMRDRDAASYGNVYGPGEHPRLLQVRCDATGVGRPVIDLIRQALPTNVTLTAVTFTATAALTRRGMEWSVGKEYLVSRLQALLQTRRLLLPDTDETSVLVQELLDYEIRVAANSGAFQAGAFGTRHDDLATALGLAVLHTEGPVTWRARPLRGRRVGIVKPMKRDKWNDWCSSLACSGHHTGPHDPAYKPPKGRSRPEADVPAPGPPRSSQMRPC